MPYMYVSSNGEIKRAISPSNPASVEYLMNLKGFDPNGQVFSGKTGRVHFYLIYVIYNQVDKEQKYQLLDKLLQKGADLDRVQDDVRGFTVRSCLFDAALIKKDINFFRLLLNYPAEIEKTRRELLRKQVYFLSQTPPVVIDEIEILLKMVEKAALDLAKKPAPAISQSPINALITFMSDLFKSSSAGVGDSKPVHAAEQTPLLHQKTH